MIRYLEFTFPNECLPLFYIHQGEQMVLRQVKNARFDFASLFPDGNEDALNRFLEKQVCLIILC